MRSNACWVLDGVIAQPGIGSADSFTVMFAGHTMTAADLLCCANAGDPPIKTQRKRRNLVKPLVDDIEGVPVVHWLDVGRTAAKMEGPLISRLAEPLIPDLNIVD